MVLRTGIYEVLTSEQASSVYGDYESIQTVHEKQGWIKNLETQSVSRVVLTNFSMPLVPGRKIGISFLNGQIVAFKQSKEIPVEDPVSLKVLRNTPVAILLAILIALIFSIPVFGYILGAVWGAYSLMTGNYVLGRYKKFRGNRLYGLFLLGLSLYSWIPAQVTDNLESMISIYIGLAVFMVVVTVVAQVIKVSAEKKYYAQAVTELNAVWLK
jgi:hypothetical protein